MGELNVKIEDLLTPEQLKQHKLRMKYNDNNMNGFSMPIKVDKDSEYVNSLTQNLNRYYDYIQNKPAFNKEPNLVNDIEKTNSKLIKAVQNYYNGNITESKRDVKHILKKFRKDDSENFFISELDKSYAFRGVAPFESLKAEHGEEEHYRKMNEVPLSFFRARTGSVSRREEMLHVPFDKRGLISTQRFSIAGIPCMYFGTTSYGCWIELDKPANKDFNVASYKFNESGKGLKILNLVLSEPLINGIFNRGMDSEDSIRKKLQIKMIKLFPIVIATSFRVLEQGRSFKSEYIISQLIMHCLKELKIDGVAYLSKKGKDDFQYPHGVNLAIPVFEKCKNEKFGEVCNNFSLTNPFNYESFLNLKEKDYGELSYINRIYKEKTSYGHDNFNSKVNFNQDSVFYGSLSFSDFDNYLVNREHLTQQI